MQADCLAESWGPRCVHQQFLFGCKRTQQFHKAGFFFPLQTVAFGELADAPDLADTDLIDLFDVDTLAHGQHPGYTNILQNVVGAKKFQ